MGGLKVGKSLLNFTTISLNCILLIENGAILLREDRIGRIVVTKSLKITETTKNWTHLRIIHEWGDH